MTATKSNRKGKLTELVKRKITKFGSDISTDITNYRFEIHGLMVILDGLHEESIQRINW